MKNVSFFSSTSMIEKRHILDTPKSQCRSRSRENDLARILYIEVKEYIFHRFFSMSVVAVVCFILGRNVETLTRNQDWLHLSLSTSHTSCVCCWFFLFILFPSSSLLASALSSVSSKKVRNVTLWDVWSREQKAKDKQGKARQHSEGDESRKKHISDASRRHTSDSQEYAHSSLAHWISSGFYIYWWSSFFPSVSLLYMLFLCFLVEVRLLSMFDWKYFFLIFGNIRRRHEELSLFFRCMNAIAMQWWYYKYMQCNESYSHLAHISNCCVMLCYVCGEWVRERSRNSQEIKKFNLNCSCSFALIIHISRDKHSVLLCRLHVEHSPLMLRSVWSVKNCSKWSEQREICSTIQ